MFTSSSIGSEVVAIVEMFINLNITAVLLNARNWKPHSAREIALARQALFG